MITEMEKWRDSYFNDKGTTYKNHVNKFIHYLKQIGKADTPNNITLDDVSNCIGYYVNFGTIQAVGTMELHLESLKAFYDYLLQTGKSHDIFSQMNYERYKQDITNKYELNEKIGRETFSIETIKDILSKLDNYLEINYSSLSGSQLQNRYLNRIALRLFIKLTLIAPAKKNIIVNLKYSDFGEDLRTVNVNEVELPIPNSLRRDLKSALELQKSLSKKTIKSDERIFKYIIGTNFSKEDINRWFCSFIKEQHILGIEVDPEKDTYSIEPIMKTAITNMVKKKANLAYVSKVCGVKIGSLEETYSEEIYNSDQRLPTVAESIAWEISKTGYYAYI